MTDITDPQIDDEQVEDEEQPEAQIVEWVEEPPPPRRQNRNMFSGVIDQVLSSDTDKYSVVEVRGRKVTTYVQGLRKKYPELEIVNRNNKLYIRKQQPA